MISPLAASLLGEGLGAEACIGGAPIPSLVGEVTCVFWSLRPCPLTPLPPHLCAILHVHSTQACHPCVSAFCQ